MFSDGFLKNMGIDPDRCRAKASLYKSMAVRAREESFSSDDRRDSGDGPLPIRDQELSGSMREGQIGNLYQISSECSQLMKDTDGREAAALAGKAYLKAGLPYGLFLSAAFDDDAGYPGSFWEDEFLDFARLPGRERSAAEEPSERDDMRAQAMKRPEQMVWLYLAASNTRRGRSMLEETYEPFQQAMDDHGHLPVGPLGIPVSAHFQLFDAIRKGQRKSSALNEVFSIAMARRSEALSLAKRNSYLWNRVRSPVALFDFHVFALANAAAMHGILNTNTFGDMHRSLDRENPLLALITAPMKMALDQSPDAEPQAY